MRQLLWLSPAFCRNKPLEVLISYIILPAIVSYTNSRSIFAFTSEFQHYKSLVANKTVLLQRPTLWHYLNKRMRLNKYSLHFGCMGLYVLRVVLYTSSFYDTYPLLFRGDGDERNPDSFPGDSCALSSSKNAWPAQHGSARPGLDLA